jgi:uncharacterized protein
MLDPLDLVDVNVTLGRWPMRRVPLDERNKLARKLRDHHIMEAWAGSYDGLFHNDLTAVNNRLAEECRQQAAVRFVPFGEINPLLAGWEDELRRCAEVHGMPGIRLHPNYHGYALNAPEFRRVLQAAVASDLIVALAVRMEDQRMMHPLLRVPDVDVSPLADIVKRIAGLRLVMLNALKTAKDDQLFRLISAGEVYVEIAMLEGVGGLERLLKDIPLERVLFGSHAPSLYVEAALLKLQESPLPRFHRRAVATENAHRLLPVQRYGH